MNLPLNGPSGNQIDVGRGLGLKGRPVALFLLVVDIRGGQRDGVPDRWSRTCVKAKQVGSHVGFLLAGVSVEVFLGKQIRRDGDISVMFHSESIYAHRIVPGVEKLLINVPEMWGFQRLGEKTRQNLTICPGTRVGAVTGIAGPAKARAFHG